ncbi:class I SAM-dependent methyltransferase [Thalassotalea fusca]
MTNQLANQHNIWNDESVNDYVSRWGELPLHEKIPQLCQIKPSDTVLDIGCGSGAAVRAIANMLSSGSVVGIDPTPRMLTLAQELTSTALLQNKATFIDGSAEKIPMADASCDVVVAVNTLHHWQDIDISFAEVKRVLKPNGRFISIDDIWEEMTAHPMGDVEELTANEAYDLKSTKDIMQLLQDKGFQQISCEFHRRSDLEASVIIAHL